MEGTLAFVNGFQHKYIMWDMSLLYYKCIKDLADVMMLKVGIGIDYHPFY